MNDLYSFETKPIIKEVISGTTSTINVRELIINPKNNYFFGEICLTQNIAWLINNEFEKFLRKNAI